MKTIKDWILEHYLNELVKLGHNWIPGNHMEEFKGMLDYLEVKYSIEKSEFSNEYNFILEE